MSNATQPIQTLRDGNIQLAIWENISENGAFYSITLNRSYKDADGNYKNTTSFSGNDLLKINQLSSHAYMLIKEYERKAWDIKNAA